MPAYARKDLISKGADCLVHTISRCVRRAWLCGDDTYSGKNFDHRREWVRQRAKHLVGFFAVEVLAYAVMSNHSHFVLWCRPSVAAGWSAEEVARRWLGLFGKRVNGPSEQEVAAAVANEERIELWRGRLGNVSWFMRCLNEWLARKANAEDECTGRFWEGRFCCQLLEDEGAVLACMAYVDLNPVRAKMAACLEESRLTGVHDRLTARRARLRLAVIGGGAAGESGVDAAAEIGEPDGGGSMRKKPGELTVEQEKMLAETREEAGRDRWLCRFGYEGGKDGGKESSGAKAGGRGHTMLAMRFEDYLELLEWTGRCVVEGKHGSIPDVAMPVLERMELDVERWVETVERYGSLYHRVAGKVENLKRKALELGQRWVSGQRKSRWVYRGMPKARMKPMTSA
jgi:REP element-mobilizing transposase RayT